MKRFAELLRVLDHTTRTGAKVDAIAAELRAALDADDAGHRADAAWTVYLLAGQRHRRVLTSRALRAAFERVSGLPAWLIEQAYAHVGDGAETVALLLRGERRAGRLPVSDATDLDAPLHVWMQKRIPALADLSEPDQDGRLADWWARLPEDQLYVLNKLLTGGLRVGVSKRLVERALAQAAALPRERVTHRLIGDLEPTAEAFSAWTAPDDGTVPPSHPYPFLLAPALRGPDDLPGGADAWWAEIKLDGIRAQIVRRAGETHLWSRGEERISRAFPELIDAAAALPDGTVLDGEIVAWGTAGPEAFGALQPRLGRVAAPPALQRRAPVRFVAYDLLERDGQDLRERPLEERRAALGTLLDADAAPVDEPAWQGAEAPILLLSPRLAYADVSELDDLRATARERGGEGLMLKASTSTYGVGRVHGTWWKHKVEPYRLDAVLLYAQAGSGRRSGLFTDLTLGLWDGDQLVPFAKAYSGLSDREFTRLGRWVRANTTERFGPVRAVPPVQVFELAFEGIWRNARRKSGLGVRFPRIVRWREDKPASEADTLASARALLEETP